MVNLQKSGDSAVKIVFTDSDHYLYGNGEIEVPVNSLLLVIDESEMVTFKKLSGDPFLSFRADNSNLGTKAAIEQFYKENMVGSTGGGISEEEVQEMIDAATSGIPSSQVIEQLQNDLNAVSGTVSSHTANTEVHVTQAEKNTWNGKVDEGYVTDYAYSKNQIDGFLENATTLLQTISGEVDTKVDTTTYESGQYATAQALNALQENKLDASAYTPTDLSEYWTSGQTQEAINAATSGKANTTAVTAAIDAAVSGKVDTSAITSSITSASTNSEIPTAKAVYDATQSGGGGMDDDTQQLISTAFNDLNDRKADLTELTKYQIKGDYVVTSTLADYMTNDAFDEYATAKERIISGALNDLNDKFGGLRLVKLTQAEYSAMEQAGTLDANTLYIVTNVVS